MVNVNRPTMISRLCDQSFVRITRKELAFWFVKKAIRRCERSLLFIKLHGHYEARSSLVGLSERSVVPVAYLACGFLSERG